MRTENDLGRTIEELGRELADCWWDQRTGGDDPRTWELTNLDCEWLRDETECSDEEWESVLAAAERGFRARCRELADSVAPEED